MAKRGFTLVELMVTAGISVILVGVISDSFIQGWHSYQFSQNASELQRQLRSSTDYVASVAENAATIASTTTINGTTYTTGAHVAVFRALPMDSNGNFVTGDDFIVIDQRSGQANVTEAVVAAAAGSTRAALPSSRTLSDLTTSLRFNYYNLAGTELVPGSDDLTTTRSVKVTMTVSKQSGSASSTRSLQTTVYMRNKTGS